jgi:hexosaminidase
MKDSLNHLMLLFIFFGLISCAEKREEPVQNPAIIPQPAGVIQGEGTFYLNNKTKIGCSGELESKAAYLADFLGTATGFNLEIIEESGKRNVISLSLDSSLNDLGEEGYKLEVQRKRVDITAFSESGIFYGIQTLLQLFPVQIESKNIIGEIHSWEIPCVSLTDHPRFKWRGLMIDCSRTFWSKQTILRYIDLLSYYKMNILHLHLVDDQGWRIEIKKYPELTNLGAFFPEKYNEPAERHGFYTQNDIKEIVRYALERNVTIIPEIEMPGHVLSALSVFPELSCEGGPFEIHPFFEGPGIHEDIYCAGNEEVFRFLESVLDEVIQLFPAEYIHIGGDEAPKDRWEKCPRCQRRIMVEGLKDEFELQSWFIRRIEKYINQKGKKLIGWDEILEGGLSETASVMYWRGWLTQVPEEVVEQGNNLIMSPTSHCYFDYDYATISTEKVYEFNPVPEGLENSLSHLVLGGQANFWSHIDRTEQSFDKQIFPRILALSEVLWSPMEVKNWERFENKLQTHYIILEKSGVNSYHEK